MANNVFIAVSLDGFIAREDGEIDWLTSFPNPDKSDFGYSKFIEQMDAIVMGRNTFNKVRTFGEWPYQLPVFLLSSTMDKLPSGLESRVEIIEGDPPDIVNQLNSQGYDELYLDGGKTIQGFLDADLVEKLIITRLPVLLGRGIPLFGSDGMERQFVHRHTEVMAGQLVQSTYTRKH